ncbi:MAG: outer membrane beta-barrel protein, partial [Bacteroidia bacterium]
IAFDIMHATHNQNYKGQVTIPDTNGGTFANYNRSVNMTYVDIPLYFRLAHDQGASYLELGPQYSILLSATETFSSENNLLDNYSDLDIKDQLSPSAWALMLGFGFDFPVSSSLFIAGGVRATYGLTDITKPMNIQGTGDYKPTTRGNGGIHLALMYRFNSYHSSKAKVKRR